MNKYHKAILAILILTLVVVVGYLIFIDQNQYIARGETCKVIDYACEPGKEHFFDGIGCGCKAIEPDPITSSTSTVRYIGRGKAECMAIDYECEPGTGHFNDDIGCGCK